MAEQKIKAQFIFEMLGKPPEHLKEALEELLKKLGEQKGIEITKKTIHEPKPFEKEGKQVEGLFTTFADVEMEVENTNLLVAITMNLMPAHVEILEPSEIRFKNFELSQILSELTVKMHQYDEIAKALTIQRTQLINHINELQEKLKNFEEEKTNPSTPKSTEPSIEDLADPQDKNNDEPNNS